MKSLVCAIVILTVIVFGGVIYKNVVIDLTDEMMMINDRIFDAVSENDFETASDERRQTRSYR